MKAVYHISEDEIKEAIKQWLYVNVKVPVEIVLKVEAVPEILVRHSLNSPTHTVTAIATQVESKDYLD